MKNVAPNIKYRIFFILGIMLVLFIGGYFIMKKIEAERHQWLYEEQKIKYFDVQEKILSIKGAPFKNLVEKIYTLWGDMIHFINEPDSAFAYDNFDILVTRYDYDVFYIFDEDFTLLYSRNALLDGALDSFPISVQQIRRKMSSTFNIHFFYQSSRGLLEIRGATINHPSDDSRVDKARGYFFAGRLWDERFIRTLEDASNSEVILHQNYELTGRDMQGDMYLISVVKAVYDWKGDEIGQIEFVYEEPLIKKFNYFANNLFLLYLVLAILLFFIVAVMINWWLYHPLKILSDTLISNDHRPLDRMTEKNDEFGRLAMLIKNFFNQKSKLEKEILQREMTEETLKKSEERFRALIRHLPDYVVLHQDGRIIYVNDSTCKKLKRSKEALIGSNTLDHVVDVDRDKVVESLEKRLSGQEVKDYEIKLLDAQGVKHDVIVRSSVISFGEKPAVLTVLVDITERKRFEREIIRSRARLNAILDNLPYKAWLKDVKGEYIAVNRPFSRYFGMEPEEIIGLTDYDICPNDVARSFEKQDQRVVETRNQLFYEDKQPDLTEGEWYETFKSPIFDDDGNVIGITGIARDITELKTKQFELIRAKEDADAANLAKQQFLSTMSHEMRTPLNAIIGITNLLIEEDPNPEQIDNLKTLNFSADHLLSLISDILDFSKIEAGKIDFETSDFNLHELVNSIQKTFSIKAAEKGLKVEVALDRDVPVSLNGDYVRLNQIITNLVGNSVKFTEEGGIYIHVSMKKKTRDALTLQFKVEDTGIGISADKLQDIFDPFVQAGRSYTMNMGGTGLGLAITKKLVELQDGKISVESKEGKGSVFTFCLPYKPGKSDVGDKKDKPSEKALGSLRNIRILLVEDNIINQVIASKYLMKWGGIVDEAENGLVAVEKVKKSTYDVVLMDLQMPEMDGYDAAAEIRKLDSGKNSIPIIALTASALLEVKQKVMDVGMNDYITKPFDPVELNHKILKYVNE